MPGSQMSENDSRVRGPDDAIEARLARGDGVNAEPSSRSTPLSALRTPASSSRSGWLASTRQSTRTRAAREMSPTSSTAMSATMRRTTPAEAAARLGRVIRPEQLLASQRAPGAVVRDDDQETALPGSC